MMHRGYEIREVEYRPVPHIRTTSLAILAGGVRKAFVENAPLAVRVIDQKVKEGRWKDLERGMEKEARKS